MLTRIRNAVTALVSDSATPVVVAPEATSPLQIYAGYQDEDIERIARAASAAASLEPDHYVDGFGVKTRYACVPFASPDALNLARLQHPIPDDGFHAEGIEYVALLDSIERFATDGSFVAVEAGAGWGPWLAMAGVVSRNRGVHDVSLVGVEASKERFALMQEHLNFNALTDEAGVKVNLFRGAVWSHDGVIHFPESAVEDMGAAASSSAESTDYRGQPVSTTQVPCCRLDTLIGPDQSVDFLHVDVQGAEGELIASHLDWLNTAVKSMMIATHSRPLEGELMARLGEAGWILLREKPCRFGVGAPIPDWTGVTTVDGSQYWINGKFT
jgi:FkbM family methyltransferase